MSAKSNRRAVYAITERVTDSGEAKSYFTRIGAAFENQDGSINVLLEAFPVSGKLQIRDLPTDDERPQQRQQPKGGQHGRR